LRALVRLGVRVSPYYIALVSADTGDREQAFEWLNRACAQRSGSLARLKTEERFRILRSDPRFDALVTRVESLTLEAEDVPAEMPMLMPQPQAKVPAGPEPMWKKFLWPDIYDDRSARWAAAEGVAATALIVASSLLALILSSLAGPINVPGFGWHSPVV